MLVDPGLADQRHRFAERLDHRHDEEVAAQLDQVGGLGFLGHDERALTECVEDRLTALASGAGAPAATTNSFAACAASGRPNTGAATNCWPASACAAVSRSESATLMVDEETWVAPRASEATIPPSPKTIPSTASSLASMVMTTSPPHVSGDRVRRLRALGGQRVDLGPRPVVDGDLVARLDQVRGHGRPHVAETDEADSHARDLQKTLCLP